MDQYDTKESSKERERKEKKNTWYNDDFKGQMKQNEHWYGCHGNIITIQENIVIITLWNMFFSFFLFKWLHDAKK